jgi:uncharacterized protein (DUF1015 family)
LKIKSFKGYRPQKSLAKLVAFSPNNFMSDGDRVSAAMDNPLSFAHVIKSRIHFPDVKSRTDEELLRFSKAYIQKLVDDDIIEQDKTECYYIYRLIMNGRSQTGIVSCSHLDDYRQGKIKKHENTREEKEKENVVQILNTEMYSNPVFLTYPPVEAIDRIVNKLTVNEEPEYDFTSSGKIRHTLWVIKDKENTEIITGLFETKVPLSYIADGHHRAASSAIVGKMMAEKNKKHTGNEPYNYFLTCFFPGDQLKIFEYNRLVKDLNGLGEDELIKKLKEKFVVKKVDESYQPDAPHYFGMLLKSGWYELKAKDGTYDNDPVSVLDVSILQKNILDEILGIKDPRTDKRLDFIEGVKGLEPLEKRIKKEKAEAAFSLFPVTMEQLFAISDAGEVMPPKSTWFDPKLLSGLIIYKFM